MQVAYLGVSGGPINTGNDWDQIQGCDFELTRARVDWILNAAALSEKLHEMLLRSIHPTQRNEGGSFDHWFLFPVDRLLFHGLHLNKCQMDSQGHPTLYTVQEILGQKSGDVQWNLKVKHCQFHLREAGWSMGGTGYLRLTRIRGEEKTDKRLWGGSQGVSDTVYPWIHSAVLLVSQSKQLHSMFKVAATAMCINTWCKGVSEPG